MNRFPLVLLLMPAFLVSCDKNDNDGNSPSVDAKTTLITASSWKYERVGLDINRDGTIDSPLPVALPACLTDNFLTLSANGSGTVDEGPTRCDATQPQTTPATWSFASNQTVLNLGGSGLLGVSGQLKILELSTTKLRLSKDTAALGVTVAVIAELQH